MNEVISLLIRRAPLTDVEFVGDVRSACIFLELFLRDETPPNDVLVGGSEAAKNHITFYVRDVVSEVIADLRVKTAQIILNGAKQ